MSLEPVAARLEDGRLLTLAGVVLLAVGLHFAVEAALGMVHAVPGPQSLARLYAVADAVLFVGVGLALLARGRVSDRRLEWAAAAVAVVVLALVAVLHLA